MFTEGVLLSEFAGLTCACLQVFEWVMCSEAKADAHRFRDIILAAIDDNKVKLYKIVQSLVGEGGQAASAKGPSGSKEGQCLGGCGWTESARTADQVAVTLCF